MFDLEELKLITPVLTVFISGLFSLLVVLAASKIASWREHDKYKQDILLQDFKAIESLFVSSIALYDKIIRYTNTGISYSDLTDELALVFARARLIADDKIIHKMDLVSVLMFQWSTTHKQGMPKPLGDTKYAIISNQDFKHQDKAHELFNTLSNEINELIDLMKLNLKLIKKDIAK